MKERPKDVETTSLYWDCECDVDYIQYTFYANCPVCGAIRENQPDSIVDEVRRWIDNGHHIGQQENNFILTGDQPL